MQNSYESHQSVSNLAKSNLSIDIHDNSITFEHMSENRTDVRYENFTFQDIMTVQPHNYEVTE